MTGASRVTRVAIVIDHGDPRAVAEAWRAAVGVSLRGARVAVATRAGSADGGAEAARARATLALFGHEVDADPDDVGADIYEQWCDDEVRARRPSGRSAPVVHLVRPGRVAGAVAAGDRVLELGAPADVDFAAVLAAALAVPVRVW
ncbi:MAG: hypothetical protein IPL61_10830 [Myxococcales bacterium]|nr:hypothetical protein [Myxococcales bacterium]